VSRPRAALAASVVVIAALTMASPSVGPAGAEPTRSAPGPTADARPAVLSDVGFDQKLGEALPLDLLFLDEQGRRVRLGDYFGSKPVVLSLVYYECPMLCTLTLNGLSSALAVLTFEVGREFEVVTVSFEPKETPKLAAAKKAAYLRRYGRPGTSEGWHFLTGDAAAIKALTTAVGFRYAWDDVTRQYAHPAGVLVLTPQGRIARYLFGIEYAPRDLRLALVEAAEARIGTPVDDLILYCYQYDPKRGRYGATVMGLVRLGGVLTLAALGAFLLVSLRRERTARPADRRSD
jgi:protein SCO1/2